MGIMGPNMRVIDGCDYEVVGTTNSDEEISKFKAYCKSEGFKHRIIPHANHVELLVCLQDIDGRQKQQ